MLRSNTVPLSRNIQILEFATNVQYNEYTYTQASIAALPSSARHGGVYCVIVLSDHSMKIQLGIS